VMQLAPRGVNVDMHLINVGMWSVLGSDHPAVQAAAKVLEDVFGEAPLFTRGGGSIPAAASFASMFGLPVVLLGFANPDDHAHAPNESMVLANYEGGTHAVAHYWEALRTTPF
jgi:acetylornithine deacetylase/succinyl-diaminopimelate desuccinylase-like protein